MHRYPNLYQINARTFINQQSAKYGRPLSLSSVPENEWLSLREIGFDFIWLMGVWQRSPAARRLALLNRDLRQAYDRILPAWTQDDVSGSPYAVFNYCLDPALGEEKELADLKVKLNRMGMGLILDFVPNHLAMDHPWTLTSPGRFVQGQRSDVRKHPDWFFSTGRSVYLAHGRDPYFAPWNDTVQVNFFSDDLRQALLSELDRISDVADGLRCDMAMLALNEVFSRVWGEVLKDDKPPASEFWSEAIPRVRNRHPGFVFIAEVYWGLDRQLQQIGFDFTYDKPFYDHLLHDTAEDIVEHLRGEKEIIGHQAHFIENHDEARAIAAFGRDKSLAAAAVISTIPGLRFYQHGQLEGCSIKVPVQLAREPVEVVDAEVTHFYRQLLSITGMDIFHEGQWSTIDISQAWDGNDSHRNILAWQWSVGNRRNIIVLNYSPHSSQAWIRLNALHDSAGQVTFRDKITGTNYVRESGELSVKGLYVDLQPYRGHFLDADI